ncbi:MAG TPA: TetR/AcrR family transcriptional regulator [Candidatus Acidoferrales bacterium]|nr:TetR/AcrR family transcriptional regulator [Candidatus Acidoferrales bacterium]
MAPVRRKPRHEARQARTDVYRQHILAAAERVFAEHGFETAKVQDISKVVGLSMGTIYAVFPSKEDLFRALLDARGRELLGLARDVVARQAPPLETVRALSAAYIDYFVAHPEFLRMHLREGTSWVLTPSAGGNGRAELWRDAHALQADIFRRGIAQGVFVDEDPGFLAKLYSAMDQVVLSDWVTSGMKASRDELVRRLQALVERAFCRATRPTRSVTSPPADSAASRRRR